MFHLKEKALMTKNLVRGAGNPALWKRNWIPVPFELKQKKDGAKMWDDFVSTINIWKSWVEQSSTLGILRKYFEKIVNLLLSAPA